MRWALLVSAALAACLGIARGQNNQDKADQLRREIAELRVRLAEKEEQARRLSPAKEVKALRPALLTIGEAGPLVGTFPVGNGQFAESKTYIQVERILDDKRFVAWVGPPPNNPNEKRQQVLVTGYPTTGLADGRVILDPPSFKVVGTEKVADRVLYALEPYGVSAKK